MEKPEQITECPRCGAETEEQAHTMCQTVAGDICPMTLRPTWDESMARLNEIAAGKRAELKAVRR